MGWATSTASATLPSFSSTREIEEAQASSRTTFMEETSVGSREYEADTLPFSCDGLADWAFKLLPSGNPQ